MRDAFVNKILELAKADPNLILVTGDLGFGIFNQFREECPEQFLNVGIAEQNMMSISAGLALSGRNVFTYSLGNFPTLRCFEQLRNDCCYHKANVTVVASGGGFSYGPLGFSHHATEELSVTRAIPNMVVVAPGTAWEAWQATEALAAWQGTAYLRLDKSFAEESRLSAGFSLGKARRIMEGYDFSIIATGGVLGEAVAAAKVLRKSNINARVISMHTVKPLDTDAVLEAASETDGILTLEEHTLVGGLGSAVAETCLRNGVAPKRFKSLGLADVFPDVVGSQAYLRARYGIDVDAIVSAIKESFSSPTVVEHTAST